MKRLTILIVTLALGMVFSLQAATITVGTVTGTSSYFPIYTLYNYNYTQQIYSQSQINMAGQISKIRFYHHSAGSFDASHDWVVYMGHTTRNSFSSTSDWEPVTNLSQVFAGSLINNFPPAGEWMEIILDTPFNYNNTSNLVVAVFEDTPSYASTVSWGAFTSGTNTGLYFYSDGTIPDPNSPPTASTMTNNIAAIQLVFPDTEAPQAPTLLSPANNASVMNGYTLEWTLPQGSADAR